jgi:hypothetical protein
MKCLVLRLGGAVARSVFTVAIPLINWLARPLRSAQSIDIQDVSREMYTCSNGRNSIPGGISTRLRRSEYFIRWFRFAGHSSTLSASAESFNAGFRAVIRNCNCTRTRTITNRETWDLVTPFCAFRFKFSKSVSTSIGYLFIVMLWLTGFTMPF